MDGRPYLGVLCCIVFLVCGLTSCKTTRQTSNPGYSIATMSRNLGIHVSSTDFLPLYQEVSTWIGTPYRAGGLTRQGADCSGFVYNVYRRLFRVNLNRISSGMMKDNCDKISKKNLRECDLVFFSTTSNKREISHVGIYLKDGYFIHASTSQGIIVNHLEEPYYVKTWKCAGRVKL